MIFYDKTEPQRDSTPNKYESDFAEIFPQDIQLEVWSE